MRFLFLLCIVAGCHFKPESVKNAACLSLCEKPFSTVYHGVFLSEDEDTFSCGCIMNDGNRLVFKDRQSVYREYNLK